MCGGGFCFFLMTMFRSDSHNDSENSVIEGGEAVQMSTHEEFKGNTVILLWKSFLRKWGWRGEEKEEKSVRFGNWRF